MWACMQMISVCWPLRQHHEQISLQNCLSHSLSLSLSLSSLSLSLSLSALVHSILIPFRLFIIIIFFLLQFSYFWVQFFSFSILHENYLHTVLQPTLRCVVFLQFFIDVLIKLLVFTMPLSLSHSYTLSHTHTQNHAMACI